LLDVGPTLQDCILHYQTYTLVCYTDCLGYAFSCKIALCGRGKNVALASCWQRALDDEWANMQAISQGASLASLVWFGVEARDECRCAIGQFPPPVSIHILIFAGPPENLRMVSTLPCVRCWQGDWPLHKPEFRPRKDFPPPIRNQSSLSPASGNMDLYSLCIEPQVACYREWWRSYQMQVTRPSLLTTSEDVTNDLMPTVAAQVHGVCKHEI